MKNIVLVSSSLRNQSTSKTLVNEVIKGLKENNNVQLIELSKINFGFCHGCLACQKTGKCVIKDDISNILPIVNNADVLIFATPIYYYSISGQLKTFLDRTNPLFISSTRKFKDVYAIFTCADESISATEKPIEAIQGWIDCFEGVRFVKSFNGLGLNSINDIKESLLIDAYNFGKNIK
jgi:multimeric flavodoxin WrbA